MIDLIITTKLHGKNLFGAEMTGRGNRLVKAAEAGAQNAARTATRNTGPHFRRMRAMAPPRTGRKQTGMAKKLRWVSKGTQVVFDIKSADKTNPYWIFQEIGTGESATLLQGSAANPKGRPKAGATYVKTTRAQTGRPIRIGLAWGTGHRGAYQFPGQAAGQQLQIAKYLSGRPFPRARVVIGKEIPGQGMVKFGGAKGFDMYLPACIKAGNDSFSGHPRVGS